MLPNRPITDFFKPFTIPKSRRPINDVEYDEIVVAPSWNGGKQRSGSLMPARPDSPFRKYHRIAVSGKKQESTPSTPPAKKMAKHVGESSEAARLKGDKDAPRTSAPSTRSGEDLNGDNINNQQSLTTKTTIPITPDGSRDSSSTPLPHPPGLSSIATPSQRVATDAHMPCTAPMQTAANASTSFSSTSTLTTLLPSSQISSKRVIKDGMAQVTNSDSDSRDPESDELEDLDELIRNTPRKKRKLSPAPEEPAIPMQKLTRSSARTSGVATRQSWRPPSPPKTVYKHSLEKLVKKYAKANEAEARIAEVEASVKAASEKKRQTAVTEEDVKSCAMEGDFVAANVGEDDGDGRLMLAMQRTEALDVEEKFFFFAGPDCMQGERTGFPTNAISQSLIVGQMLQDSYSREQACLSGFVADIAAMPAIQPLPSEVLAWFANELVFETRAELGEAYIHILQQAGLRDPVDIEVLEQSTHVINIFERSRDCRKQPCKDYEAPVCLGQVLNTVSSCEWASKGSNISQLWHLLLVNIDDGVQHDASLQNRLHRALDSLLQAVGSPDLPSVTHALTARLETAATTDKLSPTLTCRLIDAIPSRSPRLHELKRRLALSYLLGTHEFAKAPLDAPRLGDKIAKHLRSSSQFAITDTTDYALLAARISVLDIAISAGFSPLAFRANTPAPPAGPSAKRPKPSAEESAFNAQIDALVSQLRRLTSRIRDQGTTHLKRTEAKSAIERLILRLEHAARTRPKPRKSIFGGRGAAAKLYTTGNAAAAVLERFVKEGRAHVVDEAALAGAERDEVQVLPLEDLSDRDGSLAGSEREVGDG